MSSSKVSFTIRRPSPVSRTTSDGDISKDSFKVPSLPKHLVNDSTSGSLLSGSANASPKRTYHERDSDDSDYESEGDIELVTGFDRFGVQRKHEQKKAAGPLIIPKQANRDWREVARLRRTGSSQRYIPESAKANAVAGKDGSVGGLGTRDIINSGPVLSGLQIHKKVKLEVDEVGDPQMDVTESVTINFGKEETEDERALAALLNGSDAAPSGPIIGSIPPPLSEAEAYKQDIEHFPDEATLDDYARVPIEQFGAALLRGMGWTPEVTAKGKDGKKKLAGDPYVPAARPALLGIGAKEKEVLDDGSNVKGGKARPTRPEKRYVPLVKVERESEKERSGSGSTSGGGRRRSPESERERRHRRDNDRDRERERREIDRDRSGRSDRGDYEKTRDRERDREREKYQDGDRRDRERSSNHRRD